MLWLVMTVSALATLLLIGFLRIGAESELPAPVHQVVNTPESAVFTPQVASTRR
jgi:hypothetical protein